MAYNLLEVQFLQSDTFQEDSSSNGFKREGFPPCNFTLSRMPNFDKIMAGYTHYLRPVSNLINILRS